MMLCDKGHTMFPITVFKKSLFLGIKTLQYLSEMSRHSISKIDQLKCFSCAPTLHLFHL